MTQLLIEILLLLPFGMFIIKAVQALTDEGGLLRFLVYYAEREILYIERSIDEFNQNLKTLNDSHREEENISKKGDLFQEMCKEGDRIEASKAKLDKYIFFAKPLYRCPVCMASVWGTLTWLWWVQLSPLPTGTWPIYCLCLCGAMYVYENRYSPEIFIKNEVNTNDIEK